MRHCAELSDSRCCAGRCVFSLWRREARPGVARRGPRLLRRRWSKPSRPVCLTGALHPFLMSPVGTPPGEGCLEVCPRGRGEMGRRDALKLWLAPRVKKRLIRCAPGGPAQYTAPKWASPSPLFPLLTVRTSAEAPISSPSVATRTYRFCISAFEMIAIDCPVKCCRLNLNCGWLVCISAKQPPCDWLKSGSHSTGLVLNKGALHQNLGKHCLSLKESQSQ